MDNNKTLIKNGKAIVDKGCQASFQKILGFARIPLVILVGIFALGWSSPSIAGLCTPPAGFDACYEGENDPSDDPSAVQALVDAGGKILLKGTLQFGSASISISKDVEIHGARLGDGSYDNLITGGERTFRVVAPNPDPPKVVMSDLHFNGARLYPIRVDTCESFELRNSKVENVIAAFNTRYGMFINPIGPFTPPPRAVGLDCDITIENNVIDVSNPVSPALARSIGIWLTEVGTGTPDGPTSTILVSDNQITATTEACNCHSNDADFTFENNEVVLEGGPALLSGTFQGTPALLVGNNSSRNTGGRRDLGRYTIRNNNFSIGNVLGPSGAPGSTLGIGFIFNNKGGNVISGNRISFVGPAQALRIGINLAGEVNDLKLGSPTGTPCDPHDPDNLAECNIISGEGSVGVETQPIVAPALGLVGNLVNSELSYNDLSDFEASLAHFRLMDGTDANYISKNLIGTLSEGGSAGVLNFGDDNTVAQNEFGESGILGLRDDPDGQVCVKLAVGVDEEDNIVSIPEGNTVFEQGNYPNGTGGAKYQILDGQRVVCEVTNPPAICDGSTPNNVVGHPSDVVAQQEGVNPGVGQLISELHSQAFGEFSEEFFNNTEAME